jgi:hypothetical protein
LCIYGVVALIRNMSREERLDPDSALLIFIYGEGASSVNPEKLEMALRIMGHEGLGIKIVPVPEEPQAAHESKEAGNETLGEASYEELENFSLISDKYKSHKTRFAKKLWSALYFEAHLSRNIDYPQRGKVAFTEESSSPFLYQTDDPSEEVRLFRTTNDPQENYLILDTLDTLVKKGVLKSIQNIGVATRDFAEDFLEHRRQEVQERQIAKNYYPRGE